MRRGGGGRGGRGGGGGSYGRRDTRPAGVASRDNRDRRPDHRPRRTPSPDRRPRRPRGEDDDRDPPRGGRIGYGGGDRSPPRRERTGYGGRRASPRRGRVDYEDPRDLPVRGSNKDYGGDRHLSPRGSRGYGGDRQVSPRGARGYGRAPYREERDRPGRLDYESPPAYMLPDHPSDLGRPSQRIGKRESDYLGGSGDRSLMKDDYLGSGLGPRSISKDSELFGDGGMRLRISATETGRTTAMYSQDCRSPPLRRSLPLRAVLTPPPLYPSVHPDTGFLSGGSAMKASDGYGAGNTQLLHDDDDFKYNKHPHDPYIERSRDIERHYPASRDLVAEKGGTTDRFYSSEDVPAGRASETERIYNSRGMLEPDLVPSTQFKVLGDSSSSLLAKDHQYRIHTGPAYEPSNGYNMDGIGRSSHDSLGHVSGHPHRLSGSPLEHVSGHGDETIMHNARQIHSKHALRAPSMEYDANDEYLQRDPTNDAYAAPEDLRWNSSLKSRHVSGAASLRGIKDERIDHHPRMPHRIEDFESSFEAMHEDAEHINQRSYGGDAYLQYPTARGGNDRYTHSPGTDSAGIARRPARQHEFTSFENFSDQEASPMVSRKRYRSPAYLHHEIDAYQGGDGFARYDHYDDDMDTYDLSPPRVPMYDMVDDDDDEYDEGYDMSTNRSNVFSRLALPHETNGLWTDMDQGNHPHSDIVAYGYGRSKHLPMSQRLSRPSSHSQFQGTSMHGRGIGRGRGGLTKSAKKRLKMAQQFHGGYPLKKDEFIKPNKFPKLSEYDPNASEVKHEDAPEHEDHAVQKDPPEGSEEFSKQIHQAFLKYAKILNESPAMQKKYREASKGSLSCCVCGRLELALVLDLVNPVSVARKFPDVDALLSHAYDTCKAGLRTKHLGFHKALCVLMGWNWLVAPDTSKAHHSIPYEEVNAMRGDLMLWPPVVVIHDSSFVNKTEDSEEKIVSMEEIEGVLAGKRAAPIDNLEELLYAHIAVVEDLVYLDEEAKRRCKIRSKKEVEANADATLNLEP
ncbi:hypothetical protein HU200_059617 [Digitaria exilis]|uniref:XS domain-containing protein n=1 Tax=Digitaria exilis TaxID=1010633 RepID=A0A835E361_9POAL|nr:hypothetical protein HU200_059617 [Digitaria exilis]